MSRVPAGLHRREEGEPGWIGAPAALMNAITNPIDTGTIDMPATPQALWRAGKARDALRA